MYLMISKYLVPNEEVDRARADHLAFLDGLTAQSLLVTAGRQDPAVGGVVVLNVRTSVSGSAPVASRMAATTVSLCTSRPAQRG